MTPSSEKEKKKTEPALEKTPQIKNKKTCLISPHEEHESYTAASSVDTELL